MLQQFEEEPGFEVLCHRIERMGHRVHRRGMTDLHGDRVLQDFVGQFPDIIGHGGRKQQSLPPGGHVLQYPADIRQKPHVEHPVRLVQDEHFRLRQIDRALIDVIEQTAGTGYDDIDPGAQFLDLRVDAHAAVNGDAAQFCLEAEGVDGLVDLLGQFTRRSYDEGADATARSFHQALQDRQHEGRCFARSGLGKAHDVFSLEDRRDSLTLDRGWCGIAERLDARDDLWIEIERRKTHGTSLSIILKIYCRNFAICILKFYLCFAFFALKPVPE